MPPRYAEHDLTKQRFLPPVTRRIRRCSSVGDARGDDGCLVSSDGIGTMAAGITVVEIMDAGIIGAGTIGAGAGAAIVAMICIEERYQLMLV